MRHCIIRAISLVGILAALSLPASAGAEGLDCTECHNPSGIPTPHDASCQDTTCSENCHAKLLNRLQHPTGGGTPINNVNDRTAICRTCHDRPFAGVYHPYVINVSATTPTQVGEVDLDEACGQCHGGGSSSKVNPPVPPAPYLSKILLSGYAAGIHDDRPSVTFGYVIDSPNTLLVYVDGSGSQCLDGCDVYDWDWGDGSEHGTELVTSHLYASGGTYAITLTIKDTGMGSGTYTRQVSVTVPDYPPTVAGDCVFDENTWVETLTDHSTDDHAVTRVSVNWGDGTAVTTDLTVPFGPFVHTYGNVKAGGYTITQTAYDARGQKSSRTCTANPAKFTIGGTVRSRTGAGLVSATVKLMLGTTTARTVYTSTGGAFTATALKPGNYTVTVTKAGYTFAIPAATLTVGPDSLGNVISATAP